MSDEDAARRECMATVSSARYTVPGYTDTGCDATGATGGLGVIIIINNTYA